MNKNKKNRGGGCGCSNNNGFPSLLQRGGGDYFLPGYTEPTSITGTPIHSFYPANNYADDPTRSQTASRLIGGSKNKNKNTRKKKGGSIQFSDYIPFTNGQNDPITSFGNLSGAIVSNNIISSNQNDNTLGVRNNFGGITLA